MCCKSESRISGVEFFVGVSYTGSTHGLGPCRQGSIPCTPTKYSICDQGSADVPIGSVTRGTLRSEQIKVDLDEFVCSLLGKVVCFGTYVLF